ncbi:MAG: hypothetical protein H0W83_06870 [Planctomycetes bacterium]|nr:hypothetical protein [Planctomycetota bacterium]
MLVFKPFEKNLFGQTRSWCAPASSGSYVVEKSPSGETYQPRFLLPDGKIEAINGAAWVPSFERARDLCEKHVQSRLRQRIAARPRGTRPS